MKKTSFKIRCLYVIIVCLFVVLFGIRISIAADVIFEWDANTEEDLAGYKFYWGDGSRSYQNSVDVGNVTTYTLVDVPSGKCFIAVTAYDTYGNESDYSIQLMLRNGIVYKNNFKITYSPVGSGVQLSTIGAK